MAKTLASSTTLFCTAAEFIKRVDFRILCDLCSDDGSRIGGTSGNATTILTNANLLAALRDASGEVEGAAYIGGRYLAADLEAIVASDCNARGKLYRLTAALAFLMLVDRRPTLEVQIPRWVQAAMTWLEQLASGIRVFGFEEVEDAGVMDMQQITAQDIASRNGFVWQARRWFGKRGDQYPTPGLDAD